MKEVKTSNNFIIEDLGVQERWVYDIEVKDNHNFIANDILIHNSLFVGLGKYIESNKELKEDFDKLKTQKDKVKFILNICKDLENIINDYSFNVIQNQHFNSQEKEYTINWKQEIVCPSLLMVQKKKYGCWVVNEEGKSVDKIKVTGLEIIKSETSKPLKAMLKDVMTSILKAESDDTIRQKINDYKKELRTFNIEDLSSNITINLVDKYIGQNGPIKGAPWHIKGVHAHRILIKKFGLEDKYEEIVEGEKNRVVYLLPNTFQFETLTYASKYPKELTCVQPDIEKMIEKFFIKKIEMLLEPCGKTHILENNHEVLNFFF